MKNLFIFAAGAAVGSIATWKLIEKYYKDLADEEIESVVETFKNREKELKKENEEKVESNTETRKKKSNKDKDKETNKTIIQTENYGEVDIETAEEQLINMPAEVSADIIIIHPNEYGEEENYDTKSWLYWSDNVLTNENDEIVEHPEEFIGDGLSHFGDYEDDSVYVRNRANQTYYEILKTEREFGI